MLLLLLWFSVSCDLSCSTVTKVPSKHPTQAVVKCILTTATCVAPFKWCKLVEMYEVFC